LQWVDPLVSLRDERSAERCVKIAKPLLLITTPIGLAYGLYEGYRLAGGLVFLMAAMICVLAVAMGSVVLTVRRERDAERRKHEGAQPKPPDG
jgi:hypothetical protein